MDHLIGFSPFFHFVFTFYPMRLSNRERQLYRKDNGNLTSSYSLVPFILICRAVDADNIKSMYFFVFQEILRDLLKKNDVPFLEKSLP